MNPICRLAIDQPECQQWMDDVFKTCGEIFSREMVESAWWQDETPAVYKADLQAMTAYDCHKLKRDLPREVAATESEPSPDEAFLWWHKVLLVVAYFVVFGAFMLLYRWVDAKCRHVKIDEELEAIEPEEAPESEPEESPKQKKKKRTAKSWLRRQCRHMFVHSEAELRRQKAKREKEEKVHEEHTQRKIEKWTHAREREEQKRRDREERKRSTRVPKASSLGSL
ncbi:stress response protein nst1 [Drosophila guanche]|uniref:Uncharacterized protein n=1 Tax=Drosophila guanche TaxID=7266 RepID=A0A3B0KLN0_DROGU|nr:stress response protein nst1 [Drosophila guanche]SPP85981.1 Hypothetical predicted protein [Drosophila guanche]